MFEKHDVCPACSAQTKSEQWIYDLQKCGNCGYGHFKSGLALIGDERSRQLHEERWTPEHDDEHDDGCLALAAGCYALHAGKPDSVRSMYSEPTPAWWPWLRRWWKPKTRLDDLVRAGALIAAEIDRLQRKDFRS